MTHEILGGVYCNVWDKVWNIKQEYLHIYKYSSHKNKCDWPASQVSQLVPKREEKSDIKNPNGIDQTAEERKRKAAKIQQMEPKNIMEAMTCMSMTSKGSTAKKTNQTTWG